MRGAHAALSRAAAASAAPLLPQPHLVVSENMAVYVPELRAWLRQRDPDGGGGGGGSGGSAAAPAL